MSSRYELDNKNWQDLYKAAIFETNQTKVAERIAQAEWAIIVRAHALFTQLDGAVQERSALDAALYALRVLKDYPGKRTAA